MCGEYCSTGSDHANTNQFPTIVSYQNVLSSSSSTSVVSSLIAFWFWALLLSSWSERVPVSGRCGRQVINPTCAARSKLCLAIVYKTLFNEGTAVMSNVGKNRSPSYTEVLLFLSCNSHHLFERGEWYGIGHITACNHLLIYMQRAKRALLLSALRHRWFGIMVMAWVAPAPLV